MFRARLVQIGNQYILRPSHIACDVFSDFIYGALLVGALRNKLDLIAGFNTAAEQNKQLADIRNIVAAFNVRSASVLSRQSYNVHCRFCSQFIFVCDSMRKFSHIDPLLNITNQNRNALV